MASSIRDSGNERYLIFLLLVIVSACSTLRPDADGPKTDQFRLRSLVKSDMNQVMEVNVREARSYLQSLMEKLYKRNPRELAKSPYPDAGENINRIISRTSNWNFEELDGIYGAEAIELSLSPGYRGDRVFCYVVGLMSMVMASYRYKTEFFLYDSIDSQALYNSARNIELAVWKLSHARDLQGEPLVFSNSLPGEVENLSYERLFGKLIALQDTMALVLAGKNNRMIRKVIQRMATAVFLPIP